MNFSQRNRYIKPREVIQKELLDRSTKTKIWNNFYYLLQNLSNWYFTSLSLNQYNKNHFCAYYWKNFKNNCLHEMPRNYDIWISEFRPIFFQYPINILLDFLEFLNGYYKGHLVEEFEELNKILEEEKVAYRFVNGIFIEIESEVQIKEIENLVIELGEKNLLTSKSHFNKAFESLYDRKKFNYKNSIIESIQFLEALLSFKLNKENGKSQLGDLIIELNKDNFQNSDFEKDVLDMFFKIYGKLSNSGVKHGKEKFEILIEPSFSQAKLIFNLANSLASFLLNLEPSLTKNPQK